MKKLTSIFLVLAMLLTLAPMNIFAADAESSVFSDMKDTDYYAQAATALEQLNILAGYPDGTFGAEKSITRAEMAAVVCRMIDKEADAEKEKGETVFYDVESDHWASGYINIASKEGIINGYGNGKFRPENDVKHEEAIKMVVCALGYGNDVEVDEKDWSKGYLEVADEKGISTALKGTKGKASTRADVAVMSYNGLATDAENSKIPATPVASVTAGEYKGTQKVKLTTATKDAEIYYTTDGTTPTAKSTKYTKEISISKTSTLKAIAVKNGVVSKGVMSVDYTVKQVSSGGGGGGGSSSGGSTATTYTVSFDLNYEGATGAPANQSITSGNKATEPADPVREGYIFLGWSTDKNEEDIFDFSTGITSSITLYALWVSGSSDDTFKVTFVLNDGSAGAYKMQVVPAYGYATKPTDPQSEYYSFTGWYTEESVINEFDFSTRIKGDTTLYAGWGNPSGDTENLYSASSGTETIYSITGMELDDENATITVNVNSTSILLLKFLDENTEELIGTSATYTPEYCEMTEISLPMPENLPEHFIVDAQLFDNNNTELCEVVRFIKFTTKYEEFAELTVDDFEGQTVLNFDEDRSNNFGVLAEDTKVINTSDDNNILTISEDLEDPNNLNSDMIEYYTFENPTDDVKNLNVGDSVYISGTDYMFKVADIKQEENKIIIRPDSDIEMDDFYDVIKVDMQINTADQQNEVVEDSQDEASLSAEIIDVDGDWSTGIGVTINNDSYDGEGKLIKIQGNLSGSATVSVEMIYDAHLFSDDYFYCSITSKVDVSLAVNFTASIDNDESVKKKFEARKLSIPTPITGLDVFVQPSVPVEWKISGTAGFTFKFTQESGFTYDTYSGRQNVDDKSYSLSFNLEGKAELKFGPKIELGVGWGKNPKNDKYIVSANIGGQYGIKVTATLSIDGEHTNADSKHACDICIDGEAKWFVTVDGKLEFYINKKLNKTAFDITLFNYESWLTILNLIDDGKFYISLKNDEESVFEGNWKLGAGSCPNKTYRTTFVTKDSGGNEIEEWVAIRKQNKDLVCSEKTKYSKYLYDGVYEAHCTIEGDPVLKSFVVNKNAQTVTLDAESANGTLKGKVLNANTESPISGATILIKQDRIGSQNDMIVGSITTDASGSYSISLPDGTYMIEITKDDYIPFSTVEKVENGQTTYIETSLMVGEEGQGGFSGRIVDATTGNPIEGVTLKLRKGWNNSTEGDVIKTLTTNSNGEFEYRTLDVFGIIFGLQAGNYTLTASKMNYSTKSFNIVVLPGIINPNQNSQLSPTMAEGNYRFILRWGENPRDLDSHLVGPTGNGGTFHTWYSNKNYYENGVRVADLDLDDTSSYGPETTTIREITDGIYSFYVHHYAGSGNIATSGAYVEVYKGDTKINTFYAPTDGGNGLYWNVCTLDSTTGELRAGNSITNSPSISLSSNSENAEEYVDDILFMIDDDISNNPKK